MEGLGMTKINKWDNRRYIKQLDFYPGLLSVDAAAARDPVVLHTGDTDVFHIGQAGDDSPAELLRCKVCGGKDFNVGQGKVFTAIQCLTCEWEACIHDG